MPAIRSCLWFDGQAEEAANFYVSLFPNSRITNTLANMEGARAPAGDPLVVDFELDGHPFQALNGGPQFTFDEAISFTIELDTQEEVDHYWNALIADGGQPSQCGWLKDRFGLSWQVVPKMLAELFASDDREAAGRAMEAMLQMSRLDIDTLQRAFDGRE